MPDAYEIHEGRHLQHRINTSAADGLEIEIGPVPAGKVWTILAAYASASVAETRDFWFSIQSASRNYPVTKPVSFALAPAVSEYFPMLTEGMEIKIFAGEYIKAYRAAATAGSTITIAIRFIETDLPLYEYIEPLQVSRLRRSAQAALGSMVRRGGGTGGGGASGGGIAPPGGGRIPPAR